MEQLQIVTVKYLHVYFSRYARGKTGLRGPLFDASTDTLRGNSEIVVPQPKSWWKRVTTEFTPRAVLSVYIVISRWNRPPLVGVLPPHFGPPVSLARHPVELSSQCRDRSSGSALRYDPGLSRTRSTLRFPLGGVGGGKTERAAPRAALSVYFVISRGNRTPVAGMKTRCPNH